MSMGSLRRLLRSFLGPAVLCAPLLGACGYHVAGMGGRLPGDVTRVEVPIFENRTVRSDVGRILTEDFIRELLTSGRVRMVPAAEAEAVVQGTVTGYKKDPITFDAKQKPLEYRLTLVMDVALVAVADKRALFSERAVTIRVDYPVKSDLQENDRREEEALRGATRQMSQKLVSLMLEGF
jgi:outer membrane lipopolysaccharide assembly protein LptE/RlpB